MNSRLAGRSANLRMYHGNHSSPAADQRLHAMVIAGEPDLPALDAVEQMELVGGHKLASARGRVPLRKPINSVSYNGNGRSRLFRTPTGYMPSIGYARQVQLGARFLF
jgi:hypothetical protein